MNFPNAIKKIKNMILFLIISIFFLILYSFLPIFFFSVVMLLLLVIYYFFFGNINLSFSSYYSSEVSKLQNQLTHPKNSEVPLQTSSSDDIPPEIDIPIADSDFNPPHITSQNIISSLVGYFKKKPSIQPSSKQFIGCFMNRRPHLSRTRTYLKNIALEKFEKYLKANKFGVKSYTKKSNYIDPITWVVNLANHIQLLVVNLDDYDKVLAIAEIGLTGETLNWMNLNIQKMLTDNNPVVKFCQMFLEKHVSNKAYFIHLEQLKKMKRHDKTPLSDYLDKFLIAYNHLRFLEAFATMIDSWIIPEDLSEVRAQQILLSGINNVHILRKLIASNSHFASSVEDVVDNIRNLADQQTKLELLQTSFGTYNWLSKNPGNKYIDNDPQSLIYNLNDPNVNQNSYNKNKNYNSKNKNYNKNKRSKYKRRQNTKSRYNKDRFSLTRASDKAKVKANFNWKRNNNNTRKFPRQQNYTKREGKRNIKDIECFNCGNKGHYASNCPSKQTIKRSQGVNLHYLDTDKPEKVISACTKCGDFHASQACAEVFFTDFRPSKEYRKNIDTSNLDYDDVINVNNEKFHIQYKSNVFYSEENTNIDGNSTPEPTYTSDEDNFQQNYGSDDQEYESDGNNTNHNFMTFHTSTLSNSSIFDINKYKFNFYDILLFIYILFKYISHIICNFFSKLRPRYFNQYFKYILIFIIGTFLIPFLYYLIIYTDKYPYDITNKVISNPKFDNFSNYLTTGTVHYLGITQLLDSLDYEEIENAPRDVLFSRNVGTFNVVYDTMATLNFVNLTTWNKYEREFMKHGSKTLLVRTAQGHFKVNDYLQIWVKTHSGKQLRVKFYLATELPDSIPWLLSNATSYTLGMELRHRADIIIDYNNPLFVHALDTEAHYEWDLLDYNRHMQANEQLWKGKSADLNYEWINKQTKHIEDPEVREFVRKTLYIHNVVIGSRDKYNISTIPGVYCNPRMKPLAKQVWNDKKPLPLNRIQREAFMKEICQLLSAGFVEEVNSYDVSATSTSFMVQKNPPPHPGPDYVPQYRLVNDFRNVNQNLVDIHENTRDYWSQLNKVVNKKNKYFSQFDICAAYNHIAVHDDFKKYTTFIGPNGKVYRWCVMPFGLKVAPTIWNGFMERIVPKDFIYFFDNIVVGHESIEQFKVHFMQLIEMCERFRLTLRLDKSDYAATKIETFGYTLSHMRYVPSPRSKNNVIKLHAATTQTKCKSLIGKMEWIMKFLPHLNLRIFHIHEAARHAKFTWTDQCQKELEDIQGELNKNPFLIPYNPNKQLRITVDSSQEGWGYVSEQYVRIPKPVKPSTKTVDQFKENIYGITDTNVSSSTADVQAEPLEEKIDDQSSTKSLDEDLVPSYVPKHSVSLPGDKDFFSVPVIPWDSNEMPQDNDEFMWMPVEFYSQKHPEPMRKWHSTELELSSINAALDKNGPKILHRNDTIVRSDCNPIIILLKNNNTKTMSGKLYRYKDRLARFAFILSHYPGAKNFIADYFSREDDPLDTSDHIPRILSNGLHIKGLREDDNIIITNPDTFNAQPEVKKQNFYLSIDNDAETKPHIPLSKSYFHSCPLCGYKTQHERLKNYLHRIDGICCNTTCNKPLHNNNSIWVCLNASKHKDIPYFCNSCATQPNIYFNHGSHQHESPAIIHKSKFLHTLINKNNKSILDDHKIIHQALLLSSIDEINDSIVAINKLHTTEHHAHPLLTETQIKRLKRVTLRNLPKSGLCTCGCQIFAYKVKDVYKSSTWKQWACDTCDNDMYKDDITYHCFDKTHTRYNPTLKKDEHGYDWCRKCIIKQQKRLSPKKKDPNEIQIVVSDSDDDGKEETIPTIPTVGNNIPPIQNSPPQEFSQQFSPNLSPIKSKFQKSKKPTLDDTINLDESDDDLVQQPEPKPELASELTDGREDTPQLTPPPNLTISKKKSDKEEVESDDDIKSLEEQIEENHFPPENRFQDNNLDYTLSKNLLNPRNWHLNTDLIRKHMINDPIANIIEHYIEYDILFDDELDTSLIHFLKNGHFRKSRSGLIIFSTINKYNITPQRLQNNKYNRIYIPVKLRTSLIARYHDKFIHNGINKLYTTLRRTFYWPCMKSDIKDLVDSCLTCQKCKPNTNPHKTSFGVLQTLYPNNTIYMDFAGPYEPTVEGFRYVLILVDAFHFWCELIPVKTCSTFDVLKGITSRWIYQHGFPETFHADQGSGFTSDLMQKAKDVFGYNLNFSTTYNPYGNSIVEKFVGKCKDRIRLISEEKLHKSSYNYVNNWSDMLPTIQFALNCTELPSTKFSPWKLHKGSSTPDLLQIRDGIADLLNNVKGDTHPHIIIYLEDKHKILSKIEKIAADNIKQHYAKRYNKYLKMYSEKKRKRYSEFKIGTQVLVRNSTKPGKYGAFRPRYYGPYTVVSKKPNGTTFKLRMNSDPTKFIYKTMRLLKIYKKKARVVSNISDNQLPDNQPKLKTTNTSQSY